MANSNKSIHVAVGVIYDDGQFFVCRRKAHQHQGSKWEFPGGKVENNESYDAALARELKEEIGIEVKSAQFLTTIEFSYPDKHVKLHVYLVEDFIGQAHGAEGQESQWVDLSTLPQLDFPEANKTIIQKLQSIFSPTL